MTQRFEKLISASNILVGGGFRLHLTDDHLLMVERHGYAEEYRKFFFTEMQAVALADSKEHLVLSAIIGALVVAIVGCLIAVLIATQAHGGQAGQDWYLVMIPFLLALVPVAAVLLVNLWKGPTAVLFIKTLNADKWTRIPCRRRQAVAALARIRDAVVAVQIASREPLL